MELCWSTRGSMNLQSIEAWTCSTVGEKRFEIYLGADQVDHIGWTVEIAMAPRSPKEAQSLAGKLLGTPMFHTFSLGFPGIFQPFSTGCPALFRSFKRWFFHGLKPGGENFRILPIARRWRALEPGRNASGPWRIGKSTIDFWLVGGLEHFLFSH